VIVLTDADGVDELFFGAEGIVKGTCYQLTFNLPATLVLVQGIIDPMFV